ncbi:MAG: Rpn family recombination-promoting nuclease/putative transposase [Magnetococcales bacterium]|nr:Rpn family recombination-promoting nuclease/putative transposase [Magnetococcales bacterium]
MTNRLDNDSSYKLLFSHPEMVRDLLLGFVPGEWVAHLDYSTLEKVSGSFVGDEFRDREEDCIWRVGLGETWLYIYILLEFQSTVDDFMPVRVGDYGFSLFQDLRRANRLPDKKLPPILPVVIYTGKKRWNAPLEVNEMIAIVPGLEPWQPRQRYLLVEVGTLAESQLQRMRNLAAVLFRLERSRSIGAVRELVGLLGEWLYAPEQASLRRSFTVWLRRVLLPKRLPKADIPEMVELHEVNTMLAESVQEWVKPWVDQGLQQGRQEGRQEEAAAMLLMLLRHKFGTLPDWVTAKVISAPLEHLEGWGRNILFASSLEEVFVC